MAGEKKRTLHSVLHGFLSMNREPIFFHGVGKVESNVDRILLSRIAWQDSNRCAGEEALQIFSHHSLGVIEEGDHCIYFCDR